jgi:hypothetical protein
MVINKIWAALSKGALQRQLYQWRRSSTQKYIEGSEQEQVIDVLVPFGDILLRSFSIDELIKLLLVSDLRQQALDFDPINTYEKSTMERPEPGSTHDSDDIDVFFMTDPDAFLVQGQGDLIVECVVDPTVGTFTTDFGVEDFTVTNNLSSIITIAEGFSLRLQGAQPVSQYSFKIRYVADPRIDWEHLIWSLSQLNIKWTSEELRETWETDFNWINRVSAVVLNAARGSIRE